MPPSPRFARLAENPIPGNADEYEISAVFNACREAAADASLACMRARNRLGIAIAAIMRIIATTINNSISEKPFCARFMKMNSDRCERFFSNRGPDTLDSREHTKGQFDEKASFGSY